jgi:hypothetical protein
MALIDKLKTTVIGAVHLAQSTAAPAVRQTARLVRSQLDQRRHPTQPARPAEASAPTPAARPVPEPPADPPAATSAAPTPAVVAKNIAPHPEQAAPATKQKAPAKRSAPGAKLPVKRAAAKPDPA